MAKRRLTEQQKERILARQREIVEAFHEQGVESGFNKAQVVAQTRSTAVLMTDDGEQLNAIIRQGVEATACGDYVLWEADTDNENQTGDVAVVAILPRQSVLQRPKATHSASTDVKGQEIKSGDTRPFAANIDRIVIVMAHKPAPRPSLLDRYLVIAQAAGIEPVIVFNKTDLLHLAPGCVPAFMGLYVDIGYQVFATSAKNDAGMEELVDFLGQHRSVFAGQSGVGKSTLIQAAVPDQDIQTGKLTANMKGRHTTSTSILYTLKSGGQIIDTPGVRDIAVWHLDQDTIDKGFREFAPYFGRCKFKDCSHTHEPGCALQQAVEDEKVDPQRFESYLLIRQDAIDS